MFINMSVIGVLPQDGHEKFDWRISVVKSNLRKASIGLAFLAAMAMIGLVGCPGPEEADTRSDQAVLYALSAGTGADGARVYVSATGFRPIPADVWANSEADLSGYSGGIVMPSPGNRRAVYEISPGATIFIAYGADRPADGAWLSAETLIMFNQGATLWVRVVAENEVTVNYYRFNVHVLAPQHLLSNITLSSAAGPDAVLTGVNMGTASLVLDDSSPSGVAALPGAWGAGITVTGNAAHGTGVVRYAHVAGGDGTPVFGTQNVFNLADTDVIYLELTTFDTIVVYYRVAVEIGRVASMQSVQIGEVNVTAATQAWAGAVTLASVGGTSGFGPVFASLEDAVQTFSTGSVFFAANLTPTTIVDVTPTDPAASVRIARAAGDAAPEGFVLADGPTPIALLDGDWLYIEITSGNDQVQNFHKILFNPRRHAVIRQGTPAMDFDDPLWATADVLPLNRVHRGEGAPTPEFIANPHTTGTARLFWDEIGDVRGMTFLVEVNTPSFSAADPPNNFHESASVEIAISSLSGTAGTGNWGVNGGQFRVGAWGGRSGDGAAGPGGTPAAAVAFWNTNFPAAAHQIRETTATGYRFITRIPFRGTGANVPANFIPGRTLRFDIQINVVLEGGSRIAGVMWNNASSVGGWQQIANLGTVVLADADGNIP